MPAEQLDYISYLLRLRRITRNGEYVYLVSLENTLTNERKNLDLNALIEFLQNEFNSNSENDLDKPADKHPDG